MSKSQLLEILYTEGSIPGNIERHFITPLPPAPLKSGDLVDVCYAGIPYAAKMVDCWKAEDEEIHEKTGVKTKLSVFFLADKKVGKVSREEIEQFPPAKIVKFDEVRAKFGKSWYAGLVLDTWRSGRSTKLVKDIKRKDFVEEAVENEERKEMSAPISAREKYIQKQKSRNDMLNAERSSQPFQTLPSSVDFTVAQTPKQNSPERLSSPEVSPVISMSCPNSTPKQESTEIISSSEVLPILSMPCSNSTLTPNFPSLNTSFDVPKIDSNHVLSNSAAKFSSVKTNVSTFSNTSFKLPIPDTPSSKSNPTTPSRSMFVSPSRRAALQSIARAKMNNYVSAKKKEIMSELEVFEKEQKERIMRDVKIEEKRLREAMYKEIETDLRQLPSNQWNQFYALKTKPFEPDYISTETPNTQSWKGSSPNTPNTPILKPTSATICDYYTPSPPHSERYTMLTSDDSENVMPEQEYTDSAASADRPPQEEIIPYIPRIKCPKRKKSSCFQDFSYVLNEINDPIFISLNADTKAAMQTCLSKCDGDRSTLTKSLLDVLFSEVEQSYSSCSGSAVKQKLNPHRLNLIKHLVFNIYPSRDEIFVWNTLKSQIDIKCRGKKRTLKKRLMMKINQ